MVQHVQAEIKNCLLVRFHKSFRRFASNFSTERPSVSLELENTLVVEFFTV